MRSKAFARLLKFRVTPVMESRAWDEVVLTLQKVRKTVLAASTQFVDEVTDILAIMKRTLETHRHSSWMKLLTPFDFCRVTTSAVRDV